jgi:hypothetical protein
MGATQLEQLSPDDNGGIAGGEVMSGEGLPPDSDFSQQQMVWSSLKAMLLPTEFSVLRRFVMSGGYERSKFKNEITDPSLNPTIESAQQKAPGTSSSHDPNRSSHTASSSTPTSKLKTKSKLKPTSIPAQLKRNRDLCKELECLKDILGQFQDQNDEMLESHEKKNQNKQEIIKSPQREFVIQECLQIYDELGSLGRLNL